MFKALSMRPTLHTDIDKLHVATCFNSAAAHYDQAAHLQRKIGLTLLDYLQVHTPWDSLHQCLDVGCGTGFMLQQLHMRGIALESLSGMDVSAAMLQQARARLSSQRLLQADAENLPFSADYFSLVVSNLAVQWLPRLDEFLHESCRVLAPGGYLAFTTLGTETLQELAQLRTQCGLPTSVNPGISPESLAQALGNSGLATVLCKREAHIQHYSDAFSLMRDLKQLGAHHVHGPRINGLQGKRRLQQLDTLSRRLYPEGMPARYDTHFVIMQKKLH